MRGWKLNISYVTKLAQAKTASWYMVRKFSTPESNSRTFRYALHIQENAGFLHAFDGQGLSVGQNVRLCLETDVLWNILWKPVLSSMTVLSFPAKTRKGSGWESQMNENNPEMWNVNLLHLQKLPKFCRPSSCALHIYKQTLHLSIGPIRGLFTHWAWCPKCWGLLLQVHIWRELS